MDLNKNTMTVAGDEIQLPDLPWTSASTTGVDWTFQQLAPYIGRMKTAIARYLVETLTEPGQVVSDPFCGSGVVPFEALALGRHVVAGDMSPYGVLLTEAKLSAPCSLAQALENAQSISDIAIRGGVDVDESLIPEWVRRFFHEKTLIEAVRYRDACVLRNDYFTFACLLGILHHQRPGFLSFPSSHLVPYLRDKKFPRGEFPEMYEYREVLPRLIKKIKRSYRRVPDTSGVRHKVIHGDAREFPYDELVDAVITSPPYMNLLDYGRDNRLRLWFLGHNSQKYDFPRRKRSQEFHLLMEQFLTNASKSVKVGGYIALVLGDVSRGGASAHSAAVVSSLFLEHPELQNFRQTWKCTDKIPDLRRSRRDLRGGKEEVILIYQRCA